MNFYDQVLREIVAAIGAALLFGNGYALIRRRRDAKAGANSSAGAAKKGEELIVAPIGRTLAFMLLGLLMLVAGVAALAAL
ncbi:unannotated protein [freshwater metagenome]|uniref:Unannotated protein n=1 Tax=freshwater metagenome TaxID=449393 RepID=A0A6J6MBD2_9ZZZZ|nr:hypothetical protein [Actinomycetota bacterium]